MRITKQPGFTSGLAILAFVVLAALCVAACHRPDDRMSVQESAPVMPIADVIAKHAPELLKNAGVVGVYEGRTTRGAPCIRIMVAKRTRELVARLPRMLEGYAVEIDETGAIEPMPGSK